MSKGDPEMMPLNMTDVESDSALEEPAPVRRFRAPTKVVVALALLGVVVFAAARMQPNSDRSSSDTAMDLKAITELDEAAMKNMPPNLKVVMGLMGAFGKGTMNGPACLKNAPNFLHEDIEWDALGENKKVIGSVDAKGIAAFCKFIDGTFTNVNMTGFKFDYPPYVTGDKVMSFVSYLMQVKKTKEFAKERSHFGNIWVIKDGKVAKWWDIDSNPKVLNDAMGVSTAPPNADVKVMQGMMGAWGSGKFHGKACLENAKEHFTANVAIDASAPMKNTGGYKKYSGLQGLCDWCKFLETIPMVNFEITGTSIKGPGLVAMANKFQLHLADGKNSTANRAYGLLSIDGGKISEMTFALGNLKLVDDYFGSL